MKLEVNWSKFGRSLRSALRPLAPFAILALAIIAAKLAIVFYLSPVIHWDRLWIFFYPTGAFVLVLAAVVVALYFAALGAQWLFFKTIYRARHINPLRKIIRALPPS